MSAVEGIGLFSEVSGDLCCIISGVTDSWGCSHVPSPSELKEKEDELMAPDVSALQMLLRAHGHAYGR